MNRYKFRDGRQLRCGYTTGTCAAAAAEAAAGFLLTGKKTPSVSILLPAGSTAELSVEFSELEYGEEFQFAAAGTSLPADAEQNRKIFNGVSPGFPFRRENYGQYRSEMEFQCGETCDGGCLRREKRRGR